MRFGQLIVATARKEGKCKKCAEGIEPGTSYLGLQYTNVGANKRSFSVRIHRECLLSYIDGKQEERNATVEATGASQGKKNGRPALDMCSEERKARVLLQHSLWKHKTKVEESYGRGDDWIRLHWLHLADVLWEYGEVGGNKWSLGGKISELIHEKSPELYKSLAECNKEPKAMAEAIRGEFGG